MSACVGTVRSSAASISAASPVLVSGQPFFDLSGGARSEVRYSVEKIVRLAFPDDLHTGRNVDVSHWYWTTRAFRKPRAELPERPKCR